MKLSKLGFLFLIPILGCPGPTPSPTPSPTPVPTPSPTPVADTRPLYPIHLELLLRNDGTGKLLRGGESFTLNGVIPCWSDVDGKLFIEDGAEIPYLWPLASFEWMQYTKTKGGNAVHFRPWFQEACCGWELKGRGVRKPEVLRRLADPTIGGPYNRDGSWNEKFWKKYHNILYQAGALGFTVEVDVFDTWVAKHGREPFEDVLTPFTKEELRDVFNVPISPSLRKWVGKHIFETCNYGQIIYQIANESEQAPGWTKAWERAMFNLIREEESKCTSPQYPNPVVHMIGTNTRDYDGPYDYFQAHITAAPEGPIGNRPAMVNEYNPHLTPGEFKTLYCKARETGQSFWYWRSDGSLSDQTGSLNAFNSCDVASTCSSPLPDKNKLTFNITCENSGVCDATPIVTKSCDYCASIGMGQMADGTIRCSCPIRPECPGFDCSNRLPCEQWVMERNAPYWRADGEIKPADEFGFRVYCNGCSYLEACDNSLSHCKRVTF